MKPFGKRIQVRPEQATGVIQTAERNLVEKATVLAVGPEVEAVKEGDVLLFTSFGVDSVDINGERHYFLLESDKFILAHVDEQ